MGCYWLYTVLNWSGVHTCLLTCYLVAEPSAAESIQKGSLRILGCLAGSVVGFATILLIFPWLTSIGSLLLLVGAIAFIGAWIAAGGERVAYAGLQFAFAFFIAALQGYGPGFDLVEISNRIIGVLLGLGAGYLAFVKFWPVSIAARIDDDLKTLAQNFAALAGPKAARRAEHLAQAAAAQNKLGALEQDLATLNFEPPRLRPPPRWRLSRRRAAAEFSQIFGPAFLATGAASGEKNDGDGGQNIELRLKNLSDRLERAGRWA